MPFAVLGIGCAVLMAVFLLIGGVMTATAVPPATPPAVTTTPATPPAAIHATCSLSSLVPPNFTLIFCEAEQKTHTPAAMIAALYLTEHHTSSFGKDLKDINSAKGSCSSNSSGAAGPMQFIPSSWNGIADNLQRAGIAHPSRCKYRDSIIGAGFLLAGKVKIHQVQAYCKKNKSGDYVLTDSCISWWGQAYCGLGGGTRDGIPGCGAKACSTSKYFYCVQVVKKYHKVVGT